MSTISPRRTLGMRRRTGVATLLLVVEVAAVAAGPAQAASAPLRSSDGNGPPESVPGEVLVRFDPTQLDASAGADVERAVERAGPAVRGPDADTFDGAGTAYFRLWLNPDEQFDGDGAYVDDVSVECSGVYSSGSYQYLDGTSMATPHVAGVAALIMARNPGFSTAQLRARLLASVDPKASLTDKVATGGRINAFRAVTGSTTNAPPTADAGADRSVKPGTEVALPGHRFRS